MWSPNLWTCQGILSLVFHPPLLLLWSCCLSLLMIYFTLFPIYPFTGSSFFDSFLFFPVSICLYVCLSHWIVNIKFSSVAQLCPTLCDPMNHSTPGFPVHHQLLEFTQTHVHWISDAIKPSHPLLFPSPPAIDLSQHQSLFKWVTSSHEVAKVLEF